jgi:hypothetical protein
MAPHEVEQAMDVVKEYGGEKGKQVHVDVAIVAEQDKRCFGRKAQYAARYKNVGEND